MPSRRNQLRHFVKLSTGGLVLFVLACFFLSWMGYRINSTHSLPQGIWKVNAPTGPVHRGQIVSIHPPDTAIFQLARSRHYLSWGTCPGGYSSLLKPVAAVAGDQVLISKQGIAINGVLLPNSKATTMDSLGVRLLLPVNFGTYAVQPGTVWLISRCAQSFDSRYFGALPYANILGTAKPIWVGGSIQ